VLSKGMPACMCSILGAEESKSVPTLGLTFEYISTESDQYVRGSFTEFSILNDIV
jgi:hypothetical protein